MLKTSLWKVSTPRFACFAVGCTRPSDFSEAGPPLEDLRATNSSLNHLDISSDMSIDAASGD